MRAIRSLLTRKRNRSKELVAEDDQYNCNLTLDTLFFVTKYGDEIGLQVENRDVYEQGAVLALGRTLMLDGVRVDISQWADWTITMNLYDGDQILLIAEAKIPDQNINWEHHDRFVKYGPRLEWKEHGSWCKVIHDKLEDLKAEINNKRSDQELKEAEATAERKSQQRLHFQRIYEKNTF